MGTPESREREQNRVCERAVAWFITPHGLGHAARASAIISACSSVRAGLKHHLFTSVPRGFFADSLAGVDFDYHRLESDVGMVQATPFVEDIDATIDAVGRLPLGESHELEGVVEAVRATGSRMIVCDIAPLGLVVAGRLSLPGVLVENFTWDWIYRAYGDSGLDELGDGLAPLFRSATLRIQTEPICRPAQGAESVPPVSRGRRQPRSEVRAAMGIPADHRAVLLSVSGLKSNEGILGGLCIPPQTTVVAPGTTGGVSWEGGVVRIPTIGGPFHPDMVAASDLVIGKLGYSTVAEVYHGRTALAYLRRPGFPESPILEAFVDEHIPSAPLPTDGLDDPEVADVLQRLLDVPRPAGPRPNGADQAASLILDCM